MMIRRIHSEIHELMSFDMVGHLVPTRADVVPP